MKRLLIVLTFVSPVALIAQQAQTPAGGLDPAALAKPLAESWPTYSGYYTGRS